MVLAAEIWEQQLWSKESSAAALSCWTMGPLLVTVTQMPGEGCRSPSNTASSFLFFKACNAPIKLSEWITQQEPVCKLVLLTQQHQIKYHYHCGLPKKCRHTLWFWPVPVACCPFPAAPPALWSEESQSHILHAGAPPQGPAQKPL